MAVHGKRGGFETRYRVTGVAAVVVGLSRRTGRRAYRRGRPRKSPCRCDTRPLGLPANGTRHSANPRACPPAERRLLVRFAREFRRLETRFRVAGGTVRTRRARRELAGVPVFVAIRAQLVRDRTMEVATLVASVAGLLRVLSQQRERGGGMVEIGARTVGLPPRGVVATVAGRARPRAKSGLKKRAAVRIVVAILAACEAQSLEDQSLPVRRRRMALAAGYRPMLASEREARLRVREAGGRLPGVLRVAPGAGSTQLPGVLIPMARRALPPQTQERVVEVLDFDFPPRRRVQACPRCDSSRNAAPRACLAARSRSWRRGRTCCGPVSSAHSSVHYVPGGSARTRSARR